MSQVEVIKTLHSSTSSPSSSVHHHHHHVLSPVEVISTLYSSTSSSSSLVHHHHYHDVSIVEVINTLNFSSSRPSSLVQHHHHYYCYQHHRLVVSPGEVINSGHTALLHVQSLPPCPSPAAVVVTSGHRCQQWRLQPLPLPARRHQPQATDPLPTQVQRSARFCGGLVGGCIGR